jgi:hypothetical protein
LYFQNNYDSLDTIAKGFECTNRPHTQSNSILNRVDDPYEFKVDDVNPNGSSKQTPSSSSSQQMTPPKSVESLQQPLSNHNNNQDSSLSNKPGGISASNQPGGLFSSSSNMPPISYDYLNNIFEEESSADEQQQALSMLPNLAELNQPSASAQLAPAAGHPTNSSISSIQTTLSVVMTPPSHENIINTNPLSNNVNSVNQISSALNSQSSLSENDDLLIFNTENYELMEFNSSNPFGYKYTHSSTKSVKLNDYNSILSNKRRPLFTSMLFSALNSNLNAFSEQTRDSFIGELFAIPNLVKFNKNAKYKKINLSNVRNEDGSFKNKLKLKSSAKLSVYETNPFLVRKLKKLKWNLSIGHARVLSRAKTGKMMKSGIKLDKNLNIQYVHLNSSVVRAQAKQIIERPQQQQQHQPQFVSQTSISFKQSSVAAAPSTPTYVSSPFAQQAQPNTSQSLTLTRTLSSSSYPGSVGPPTNQPPSVSSIGTPLQQQPLAPPPMIAPPPSLNIANPASIGSPLVQSKTPLSAASQYQQPASVQAWVIIEIFGFILLEFQFFFLFELKGGIIFLTFDFYDKKLKILV